ncbi:MAG: hypothetical protein BWY31_04371 [Lentisphaerae bacterium ADurb.Bin242]|nr:MAG: hypothetical protein BWY31_04371 [Lentisphaerae bacterium ADurb.Bin242]
MTQRHYHKKPKTAVRLKRMMLGLYQWELAELMHVKPPAVSRWETHGVTAPRTAKKLAAIFHCDWKDLID